MNFKKNIKAHLQYRDYLVFIFLFIISLIIGFFILNGFTSQYFKSQIENVVLKSNNQLQEHYGMMQQEYQKLNDKINNITAADSKIYEHLFGASAQQMRPYQSIENVTELSKERDKELNNLSFNELIDKLDSNSKKLEEIVVTTEKEIVNCENIVKKNISKLKFIPSIQPVYNNNLNISITPAGMCINPFFKSYFFHRGIDYSIPEGTRIFATADGVVKTVRNNGSQGGTIVIDHRNRYQTVYSNMSKINYKKGRNVKRGDIIGYSGNTGSSFLPHLHYEVRYNFQNLDPMDFFFGQLSVAEIERIKEDASQNIQSFD